MLRILLVDDESVCLKGMEYILQKYLPEHEIVAMLGSAPEALELLEKEQVDVVITDVKMPEMDGVEFTKQVCSAYSGISVIVISAYSDFEFVRQCMKNGAVDYLLKPCSYEMIIDVLDKLEDKARHKNTLLQKTLEIEHLKEAILGEGQLPEYISRNSEALMIISVLRGNGRLLGEKDTEYIAKEFEKLKLDEAKLIVIDENFILVSEALFDLVDLKQALSEFRKEMGRKGISVFTAVRNFKYVQGCLEKVYKTGTEMIGFLLFNEISSVIEQVEYDSFIAKQKEYKIVDFYSAKIISNLIASGKADKVESYLDDSLKKLYGCNIYFDPVKVKMEFLQEIILLENRLKERNIEIPEIMGKNIDYLYEFKRLRSINSFLNWIRNFTITIAMYTKDTDNVPHYIRMAIKYIFEYYMTGITLTEVADKVYLNPWYLSSQFKRYINITFVEYLNKVRVDAAKDLLKQKDLKIFQVAEMVGFQDATYFATVFKSLEHITPKEYQKNC